jgi:membrane-bound ClpP family serine protease
MDIAVVVTLLLVGVILMLIEIFLIPGLSVAGIGSLIFLGGAVFYAYSFLGSAAGHLTFISAIVLLVIAIWIFLRSKALEKMSLKAEIDGKNDPLADVEVKEGDEGVSVSRLAPMGKIKVNGHVMEAKSMDEFVDENTPVVVIKVLQTNVIVERKKIV